MTTADRRRRTERCGKSSEPGCFSTRRLELYRPRRPDAALVVNPQGCCMGRGSRQSIRARQLHRPSVHVLLPAIFRGVVAWRRRIARDRRRPHPCHASPSNGVTAHRRLTLRFIDPLLPGPRGPIALCHPRSWRGQSRRAPLAGLPVGQTPSPSNKPSKPPPLPLPDRGRSPPGQRRRQVAGASVPELRDEDDDPCPVHGRVVPSQRRRR